SDVVAPAVVVQRQFELDILAGRCEEVVRRLQLTIPDDRELAFELEPQRLVEAPARLEVGDPVHRVEESRHARIIRGPPRRARSGRGKPTLRCTFRVESCCSGKAPTRSPPTG